MRLGEYSSEGRKGELGGKNWTGSHEAPFLLLLRPLPVV